VAPPLEKPAGLTRAHAAGWNLTKNNGMAGNCYRDSENLIVGCLDSHFRFLGAHVMRSRHFSNWWFRIVMSGRLFEKLFGS
jgi:hypothetical protein